MTVKESGYITTSLRLSAEENKTLRDAAAAVGISFNGWAINTLNAEAKKILKRTK